MPDSESRVTVHMAASLDGFIARKDGRVDWMETADVFEGGEVLDPAYVADFLSTIDCYVMGSHTYELALDFESKGLGWAYGDKPVVVLTSRPLRKSRGTVQFCAGDLAGLVNDKLRRDYGSIWIVGGGMVCGEAMRLGIVDEVRVSIMPVLIGEGIPFFTGLNRDVTLHLTEARAYHNGIVALCHAVRR